MRKGLAILVLVALLAPVAMSIQAKASTGLGTRVASGCGIPEPKPTALPGCTHRPIVELFTGLWCPPCMGTMHHALDLYFERDWEEPDHPCHIIEFHVAWGRRDALATAESESWANNRDVTGVPTYWVDMVRKQVGASPNAYPRLKEDIASAGDDEVEPVVLLVELERDGKLFNVTVHMKYVGLQDSLDCLLYVFMVEDNMVAYSTVLEDYVTCNHVFRGMAVRGAEVTLPRGEWVTYERTWDGGTLVWDPEEVHAVAVLYVQVPEYPCVRAIASACDICSAHDMTDHEAPEVDGPHGSWELGAIWPGEEVEVWASVSDGTGVMAVFLCYRVDGGDWQELRMSWNGTLYRATIGPFEAGAHVELAVRAYDIPGNEAEASASFTVQGAEDTTPPTIEGVWTEPSEPEPGQAFKVKVRAYDEGSGVASVLICYHVSGGGEACIIASQVSEDLWEAEVPGQPAGSTITINATVTDRAGNTAYQVITVHIKSGGGGGGPGLGLDVGTIALIGIGVGAIAVALGLVVLKLEGVRA